MPYFSTIISSTHLTCFNANDGRLELQSHNSPNPPFTYSWLSGISVLDVDHVRDGNGVPFTPSSVQRCNLIYQSFTPSVNGILDSLHFWASVPSVPYSGIVQIWDGQGTTGILASAHPYFLDPNTNGVVTIDLLNAPPLEAGREYTFSFLTVSGTMSVGIEGAGLYPDGIASGPGVPTGADLIFGVNILEDNTTNRVGNTPRVNSLPPGKYSLIMEDFNGDYGFGGVYIDNPPELILSALNIQNPTNPVAFDGSITANAVGGLAPYYFTWQHGPTTQMVSGLGNGTYTVECRDSRGCTQTIDFTLTSSLSVLEPEPCPGMVIEPRLIISRGDDGHFLTVLDQDYTRILHFAISQSTLENLAELIIGGSNVAGRMVLKGEDCRDAICLDGHVASIVAGCEFMNGEVIVRDERGNDMIRLDGESGSILLGGNNVDGILNIYTADGDLSAPPENAALHFNANTGDLELNGNLLDGGRIVLRKNGDDAIIVDAERAEIEITNADFAEDFDIASMEEVGLVEPGMVMVFDPEGKLRPCKKDCDPKVAGIVSGAGDFKPGIVMDKRREDKNRLPVALAGKAFCYAETLEAAIEPGDLLTTSHIKGHAKKAVNPAGAIGAVIGKALKGMPKGQTGLIPVKVGLM